ncbi:hypothetical protein [uncultured Aquimonas sp.]|uniref:hypothetical protein n=1 Tax=uncultured Aquimonas sp. TaxID=385483 RepID=UPI0026046357|nr:hypothetical protein [uncultured Aquimonas sp.]
MRFNKVWVLRLALFASVVVAVGCDSTSPQPKVEGAVVDSTVQKSDELSIEERNRLEDEASSQVDPLTESLDTDTSRETQFGTIEVAVNDGDVQQLLFEGSLLTIDGIEGHSLRLGPVWRYGDADLLLVELGSGGTACPSSFVLLIAKAEGIFHSKPFGSCSDLVRPTPRDGGVVLRIGFEAYFASADGVRQIRVADALKQEQAFEIDNPSENLNSVLRPLVEADMKVYRWCGLLEQANLDDPKNAVFVVALGNPQFKFYAVSFKEENWRGQPIRIGGHICVTGRYFTNIEAETVLGVRKTLPALTVFRISGVR